MEARNVRQAGRLAAALAAALLAGGCGLDDAEIPPLAGPSELALSLTLTATPDTINADGSARSLVRLVARDEKGAPLGGLNLAIVMIEGDGFLSGGPGVVGPLQFGLAVVTDAQGSAQVVYTAGRVPGTVLIGVRPYSSDATALPFLRQVGILQL